MINGNEDEKGLLFRVETDDMRESPDQFNSYDLLEKGGLKLEWRNLSYRISLKKKKPEDPTDKIILNNITGVAISGQLLAILGPSGSGKTSLLNALAGRIPLTKGAELTGKVFIDGVDVATENLSMPLISAYVMQDDALFSLSTVKETLMFVALMRLPSNVQYVDKCRRVQQVIRELGLVKAANTVIGSARVRGVSGGERKRVNIGVDLLHNPRLIFVDEPTSGLDSFQALSVMETLSSLAKEGGRTVVCSVHQPRSKIYNMLDSMLLLSNGQVMYFGPAGASARDYFSAAGSPVPQDFNPADHFLDVISVDYRTQKSITSTQSTVQCLREYYDQHESEPRDEMSRISNKSIHDSEHIQRASFCTTFILLFGRSWREQTRDKATLSIKYFMNTFFSLTFGLVYFRMDFDQTSLQNRTGILFFMAMNQAFGSAISIAQIIPVQLKVVSRERAAKLYGSVPYYLATFATILPLELVPQFGYSVLVYYMTDLRHGWDHLLIYIGIMMLENFVAIGLGMVLSSCFKSPEMAGQIAPAVVILFLMFSGYFLNDDSIPIWLSPLKYISFIRYAFQALCVNEFAGAKFDCPPPPQPCLQGDDWLQQLNFGDVQLSMNCIYLGIELLIFHVMALLVMIYKRPKFLKMSNIKMH